MEYSKRDKIKKILKYVAIIAGVLLVLILGLLFIQAHHNAATKGQPYSIKKFIIDFGASIRGKQISDPSVFDGGLFPLFGLNGDGNLPIDGSGTNGGTTINTDGSGNGTGTDGTNGNGTGTDGGGTNGTGGNSTGTDGTGGGTDGTQTPQCSDRVDNDADGAVDMDDPDCTDPSDYFESTYNWDTGGDGFYNYDNGTYGPIDFGDFGFDPNYNFDDGFTDTTAPEQCVPKDYIFTDAEQLDMDKYLREFYRIAPNIRTQADVDAEIGAKESYESLTANADRLLIQCKDERLLHPNSPFWGWNAESNTNTNFLYTGARSLLENLININASDIPRSIKYQMMNGGIDPLIGYPRTPTFFPPDTKSLPRLSADELVAVLNKQEIDITNWPGDTNDEKLRNATCMVRNGSLCYDTDPLYIRINAGAGNNIYGTTNVINSILDGYVYSASQLGFSPGNAGMFLTVTNPQAGIPLGSYTTLGNANDKENELFWDLTSYEGTSEEGPNAWNELNLGACYIEMFRKYPTFWSHSDPLLPTDIDRKTFWNMVTSCDDVYDNVNTIRQSFESTFGIN